MDFYRCCPRADAAENSSINQPCLCQRHTKHRGNTLGQGRVYSSQRGLIRRCLEGLPARHNPVLRMKGKSSEEVNHIPALRNNAGAQGFKGHC